jgi:hypothetical protein
MPEHAHVDQVEFRWQEGRDLSPRASSFDSAAETRGWFGRLAGLVRAAAPDLSQGVPGRSAAYQTFADDGTAALIWRLYEPGASAVYDQSARTPLVARAFIGRLDVLTPGVAIALCRSDVIDRLSPQPGDAAVEYGLSPLLAGDLVAEAKLLMEGLDEQGRLEEGLATLIAAALRDRDVPLSVVLPGPELTQPLRDCPQLTLLWGLWRTTAQLLAGPDAIRKPGGGWSFSTYEPPPGDTETRGLPAIVFRGQSAGRARKAGRVESRVEPRALRSNADDSDVVAGLLADAYRTLGGHELEQLLHAIASEHDGVDGRLDACRRRLRGLSLAPDHAYQAEPETAAQPQPSATGRQVEFPPGQEAEPLAVAAEYGRPTVWPQDVSSAAPAGPQPPTQAGPAPMPEPIGPSAGGSQVPRPTSAGSGHRKVPREQQWTLTAVLEHFHRGPERDGFATACEILSDGKLAPSAKERAKARKFMPEEDWYLPAFIEANRWHVEDMLEILFTLAVIPDLGILEVRTQVANWVTTCPPEVIRALSAAAHHQGEPATVHLAQILRPRLHQRWLREHSIHFHLAAVEANPVRSSEPRPVWQIVPNGPHAGLIGSVLAWLCLLLLASFLAGLLR